MLHVHFLYSQLLSFLPFLAHGRLHLALEKVEKKEAGCTETGHEAYWRCKNCAKLFSDEAGTHEINNPLKINANGHALEKVEKKEAGCTETGHEAYWRCKNCAKLF